MKRLLVLAALLLFAFLAGRFYLVTGDDATYLALARSIHEGRYASINVPGDPPQVQYPPLFPLLLYPIAALPPESVGTARLWVAAWSVLAVAAVALAARRRDPATGLVAALPFAVSPLFGEYGTSVLPEILFIGLCYAVLVRLGRSTDPGAPPGIDPFIPLGLGAAWLLKSAALPLVLAALSWLAWKRRAAALAATVLVLAVGMAPWWLWQASHGSDYVRSHILQADIYDPSSGVLSPLEIFTRRVPHNAARYAGRIAADVLLPPFFRAIPPGGVLFPLKVGASLAIAAAVLGGALRRVRSGGFGPEELFVVLSVGMYLVHPVYSDRYLFSIYPSLAGYLLHLFSSPVRRARVAVAWSAILVAGSVLAVGAPVPREDVAYFKAVEWVGEHARANDLVLARKPAAVWFYTGRKAMSYPATTDTRAWPPGARFVIRDSYTIGVATAALHADPVLSDGRFFRRVYVSDILPEVRIYEARREEP